MATRTPDPRSCHVDKIIEWMRHNWHEPGSWDGLQGCEFLNTFLHSMWGCESGGFVEPGLLQQVFTIGNNVNVGAQRNSIHLAIIFGNHICPCGMDKCCFAP